MDKNTLESIRENINLIEENTARMVPALEHIARMLGKIATVMEGPIERKNMNEENNQALKQANEAFAEARIGDANRPNPTKLLEAVPEYAGQPGAMTVPTDFVERLKARVYIGADRPETDSTKYEN